ncbi:hypothetical protein MmiAt1_08370 [Methanimicrococcus sp. At1]|uniref:Uncharacterized protein n=1 Tax=Methanimicrococcus hacksteinii TaxID=3028293 RepID=A0ABU3VPP8_9EURY|nr:InlB B-repeat-containing protein [Methanimicrococcus sp. At1]MDV0445269.1 hypothetical protein [Methanimicrococcus sp. At1]
MKLTNRLLIMLTLTCMLGLASCGVAAAADVTLEGEYYYTLIYNYVPYPGTSTTDIMRSSDGDIWNDYKTVSGSPTLIGDGTPINGLIIKDTASITVSLKNLNIVQPTGSSLSGAVTFDNSTSVTFYIYETVSIRGANGIGTEGFQSAGKAGIDVSNTSSITQFTIYSMSEPANLFVYGGNASNDLGSLSGAGAGIGGPGGYPGSAESVNAPDINCNMDFYMNSTSFSIYAIGGTGTGTIPGSSNARDIGGGSGAGDEIKAGDGGSVNAIIKVCNSPGILYATVNGIGGGHGGSSSDAGAGGNGGFMKELAMYTYLDNPTIYAAGTFPVIGGGNGGAPDGGGGNSGDIAANLNLHIPGTDSIGGGYGYGTGSGGTSGSKPNTIVNTVSESILFDANGGTFSGSSSSQHAVFNPASKDYDNIIAQLPTLTADELVFKGWYSNSVCNDEDLVSSGDTLSIGRTYYAGWIGPATITLNLNNGALTDDSYELEITIPADKVGDKAYIDALLADDDAISYDSWSFGGWWSTTNTTGLIDEGTTSEDIPWDTRVLSEDPLADETFYALWYKDFKLNANGGMYDGVDTNTDITVRYQPAMGGTILAFFESEVSSRLTYPVETTEWTRSENVWGMAPGIINNAWSSDSLTKSKTPVDLYAKWEGVITLDTNGGDFAPGNSNTVKIQPATPNTEVSNMVNNKKPDLEGMNPLGWYTEMDSAGIVSGNAVNEEFNFYPMTLYAGYFKKISVVIPGGSSNSLWVQYYHTEADIEGLLIAADIIDGSLAVDPWELGWYTTSTDGIVDLDSKIEGSLSSIVLNGGTIYAGLVQDINLGKFGDSEEDFIITIQSGQDLDDISDLIKEMLEGENAPVLDDWTPVLYVEKDGADDIPLFDEDGEISDGIVIDDLENLYIVWTGEITLDANGGTFADEDFDGVAGIIRDETTLGELPVPEYEGWDFAGWFGETDENGVVDLDSKLNDDLTFSDNKDELYAGWTKTVSLELNDTDGNPIDIPDIIIQPGEDLDEVVEKIIDDLGDDVSVSDPTKPGHTFGGWELGGDNGGELVPIWIKNPNGGSSGGGTGGATITNNGTSTTTGTNDGNGSEAADFSGDNDGSGSDSNASGSNDGNSSGSSSGNGSGSANVINGSNSGSNGIFGFGSDSNSGSGNTTMYIILAFAIIVIIVIGGVYYFKVMKK